MKYKNIIYIFLFAITIKIVYIFTAVLILKNAIDYSNFSTFIGDIFFRWDSHKYYSLIINGYPHSSPEILAEKDHIWAFFPLYPGIISVLMKVFSLSFNTAAFFWSLVSSLAAFLGIYWFCNLYFNNTKKSLFITILFLFLPFSYYFSAFLTESTFLLLLIFSFISIYKKKYFIFSILSSLLVLVRANGMLSVFILFLFFLENKGIIYGYFRFNFSINKELVIKSLFFVPPVLVFLCYCLYQYYMTGDFFAFSTVQKAWGRTGGIPHDFIIFRIPLAILSLFLFVYFLNVKKNQLSFTLLILLNLLLPISTGTFGSIPRYSCTLFPLYIIVGNAVNNTKIKWFIVALTFSIQIYYYILWLKLSFVTA